MPKKSTKSNVKQMWGFIAPYKWGLIIAIAMVFVTSATLSISPMFEGRITTQLVSDVQGIMNGTLTSVHFTAILQTILILAILYAIKTISQVVMSFMLTNAIQNTTHDLRKALQKRYSICRFAILIRINTGMCSAALPMMSTPCPMRCSRP